MGWTASSNVCAELKDEQTGPLSKSVVLCCIFVFVRSDAKYCCWGHCYFYLFNSLKLFLQFKWHIFLFKIIRWVQSRFTFLCLLLFNKSCLAFSNCVFYLLILFNCCKKKNKPKQNKEQTTWQLTYFLNIGTSVSHWKTFIGWWLLQTLQVHLKVWEQQ